MLDFAIIGFLCTLSHVSFCHHWLTLHIGPRKNLQPLFSFANGTMLIFAIIYLLCPYGHASFAIIGFLRSFGHKRFCNHWLTVIVLILAGTYFGELCFSITSAGIYFCYFKIIVFQLKGLI